MALGSERDGEGCASAGGSGSGNGSERDGKLAVLDPNSYTAHRLHHGKPEHLHITSRRIFVGPIPTDWYRGHRKEWYSHRYVPSMHYSSRQQSTLHAPNIRTVNGLDRIEETPVEEEIDENAPLRPATPRPESIVRNYGGIRSPGNAPDRTTQRRSVVTMNGSVETAGSGTPLLQNGEEGDRRPERTSTRASADTAAADDENPGFFAGLARTLTMRPTSSSRKTPTLSSRVTTGLVRFNTPANRRDQDDDLQRFKDPSPRKIGHLQRSRSLHRAGKHHGRKTGEIIKMDTMLVRVEVTQTKISDGYDENESGKVITRVADKWREYVVVCREGYEEDAPMVLNLYKSRSIPAVERPKVSKRSHREITLDMRTTKVNIYSSLDKTLVIWLPYRYGTIIYIMRPRCSSASVEWYSFLRNALGEQRPNTLNIAVPDLSLTLQIDNPFGKLDRRMELDLYGTEKDDNYLKQERAVVSNLLRVSMSMLEGVPEWADIVEHWKRNERMGLAWRRYDRLEWVHGLNEQRMHGSFAMERTHDLELRPKTHYPTETRISQDETMTEPPPVEGFLMRLTSGLGRQQRLGKVFQKCLYFSTHDSLLCFCRPARAIPPVHPSLWEKNGEMAVDEETARNIALMPIVWTITPYSLNNDGDIEWLKSEDQELVNQKDREAYQEAERRVNTLLMTEGLIDLCNVEEVRTSKPPPNSARGLDLGNSFELVLKNGLTLELQACNQKTRDEWVLRLTDLIKYWKARSIADLAIIRRVRNLNLQQLCVDEEMESLLGQYARKWEVSRTIASPDLYNVCGLSSCHTITMSGVLYRKPRRRSTFRRTNVILCHGELLIFSNTARDKSGKAIPTVYQERVHTLDLKDCYIYSGHATSSDLLYQNQTFDSNAPGRHALPRIYADGYTSRDEDEMTCFVVWQGKRGTFTARDNDGKQVKRKTTKLGTVGRAQVFKARSRLERDTWVMSIAMEIERLNAGMGKEVKVVPPKSGGRVKVDDDEEEM